MKSKETLTGEQVRMSANCLLTKNDQNVNIQKNCTPDVSFLAGPLSKAECQRLSKVRMSAKKNLDWPPLDPETSGFAHHYLRQHNFNLMPKSLNVKTSEDWLWCAFILNDTCYDTWYRRIAPPIGRKVLVYKHFKGKSQRYKQRPLLSKLGYCLLKMNRVHCSKHQVPLVLLRITLTHKREVTWCLRKPSNLIEKLG